ncbi:N-acetyltransferase [Rhizobium sp. RMa-01]|uniref:GNAT family N-acetyltransferase n=1 Tax=unclassified Rhizobium TaxID=2613769 RepID=UPI0008D8E142|nr:MULTISPECIES: GNAT family protein [unclassified Rhizobium]OHV19072.1 GCN5 family acetyltransferase [Rhizobium sp. RSm-3]RVU09507.1 N-acetyltransferase [Rhizobium sp. RMa-01]
MAENMLQWTPRPRPDVQALEGRFVGLEKLDPETHTHGLFDASVQPDGDERFRWLPDVPPTDRDVFRTWVEKSAASEDPLFYAVIDKASGKVAGRQTFMRIDAPNGVAEIGNIYWGPMISRKPAATEALYLFARYLFDDLGYRRFEWKCNNDNLPSKRAALRFGFQYEGLFRQHLIVKGLNRDTAWFAMIDKDWVALKPAYEAWLAAENFYADGQQKRKLEELRREVGT